MTRRLLVCLTTAFLALGACDSPGGGSGDDDATTDTAPDTTPGDTAADTGPADTTIPDTAVPDTAVPDTTVPDTAVPDTAVPDTTVPDTTVPDTEDDTAIPDTVVPDTEDDTAIPDTVVPDTEDDTAIPDTVVPDTEDDTAIPDTVVPDTEEDTAIPDTVVPDTVDDTALPDTAEDTAVADTEADTALPDTAGDTMVADTVDDTAGPDTADDTAVADADDAAGDADQDVVEPTVCEAAEVVDTLPYLFLGSTTDASADLAATACAGIDPDFDGSASNDVLFAFTAPADGEYVFGLLPFDGAMDSLLYVFDACPTEAGALCGGANDVIGQGGDSLVLTLATGATAWVVVDGYDGVANEAGDFALLAFAVEDNESDCTDGLDTDLDDLIDCADVADCGADPACQVCDGAIPVTAPLPFTFSGTTAAGSNQLDASSCGAGFADGSASSELLFSFVAPADGDYAFGLEPLETGLDALLYVFDACPTSAGATCLAVDDVPFAAGGELLTGTLATGAEAWIVVDGWSPDGDVTGAFTLLVWPVEETETACDDGLDNDVNGLVDCDDVGACAGVGSCPAAMSGAVCADPLIIDALPYVYADTTVGMGNEHATVADACPEETAGGAPFPAKGGGSQDVVFRFTPAASDQYLLALSDIPAGGEDMMIVVYTGECPEAGSASTCVAAADLKFSDGGDKMVLDLEAGTPYWIVVDGWATAFDAAGLFELVVDLAPDSEADCFDGFDEDGDGLTDCADTDDCGAEPLCAVDTFAAGDLALVELMGNPATVSDNDGEYVEILNTTGGTRSMNGVSIAYRSWVDGGPQPVAPTNHVTFVTAVTVAPGARLVAAKSDDTAVNGGITPQLTYGGAFGLSNAGDRRILLQLVKPGWDGSSSPTPDQIIDEVVTNVGTFVGDGNGASFQLSQAAIDAGDPAAANDEVDAGGVLVNWCYTPSEAAYAYHPSNYGTPGADNVDCGGEGPLFYATDVQPILQTKCTPCHTGATPGTCSGGACHASFYADIVKASAVCAPGQVYDCALQRIQNGSMPFGKGCGGPVADDAASASQCVTVSEYATLEAWVAGGALEAP